MANEWKVMRTKDSTFARIDNAGGVTWGDQFRASLFSNTEAALWKHIFGMQDGLANYALIYSEWVNRGR